MELNGLGGSVEIVAAAAGSRAGMASLTANLGPMNHLVDEGVAGATTVTMITLDNTVKERGIERVRLMKIDVEGFEFDVLAGGARPSSGMRRL